VVLVDPACSGDAIPRSAPICPSRRSMSAPAADLRLHRGREGAHGVWRIRGTSTGVGARIAHGARLAPAVADRGIQDGVGRVATTSWLRPVPLRPLRDLPGRAEAVPRWAPRTSPGRAPWPRRWDPWVGPSRSSGKGLREGSRHCRARRRRTDLGTEPDRSRRGTGPISARNWTDLGERKGKGW